MYRLSLVFIILLNFALLWSFGEPPLREGNIASKISILGSTESDADYKQLSDKNLSQPIKFKDIIIDISKLTYLDKVEIFSAKNITGLKLSEDIINWTELVTPSAINGDRQIYDLEGREGRYLKFIGKDELSCSEIAIYAMNDYTLQFLDISASPNTKDCVIHVKTNVATLTHTIYGYNYDFIYNKKLEFSISTLTPGKEHYIKITDLMPATTYRYQVKVTDFNDRTIFSNFFTFTTKDISE